MSLANAVSFPRVLIISPDSLGSPNGTGVMLDSLFKGWPSDRLANLYYSGPSPTPQQSEHTWHASDAGLAYRVFSKLERSAFKATGNDTVPGLTSVGEAIPAKVRAGLMFRALGDLSCGSVTAPMRAWARSFKPDVIYSLLWGLKGLSLTNRLVAATGAALIPHFMDDWPETAYREAFGGGLWRAILRRRLDKAVKAAPLGLAICDDMSVEFGNRYGLRFEAFMRCLERSEMHSGRRAFSGTALRLIYTGGLHLGRAEPLALVGAAVEQLKREGLDAALTVYSPRSSEKVVFEKYFGHLSAVHWGGSLSVAEAHAILSEATAGVHAESFHPRAVAYTKYSMSTKFPSYFAAGLPVFAVGPEEISSVRYIKNHGLGPVVSSQNVAEIASSLRTLLDPDRVMGFHNNAKRHFLERYEGEKVRDRFADCLRVAAQGAHSPKLIPERDHLVSPADTRSFN